MGATVSELQAGRTGDILVEDVTYLDHGGKALLARLYRPHGAGPFPMMIDLHGGAWCAGDRLNDSLLCEAMARAGILVAAIDFRQPPDAMYPDVMADIHFAVRWLKAQAGRLGGDPQKVGLVGISSGGHQAMLLAMRPGDARYGSIQRPEVKITDASVGCVVLCWPVIDPLGRYHYGKELIASGGDYPEQLPRVLPSHDKFWGDEAAMAEGSPLRILERGESVVRPPVLYLQGDADRMHPRPQLDRFVTLYREKGGSLDLALYSGEVEGFVTRQPRSMDNQRAGTERIIAFTKSHLG